MAQLRHYFGISYNSAFIGIFLLIVIICGNNVVALSLKGTEVTFLKSGDQVPVDIIAENLENGISRYNISIVVDSPDVATVSRLFFPVWAENRLRTELPSPDVWMSAEDVSNTIKKGTTSARLGMVVLSSLEPGYTGLKIHVTTFEDDDNNDLSGQGATDFAILLVPNKTITMTSPGITRTTLLSVSPTLTLKPTTLTVSKINNTVSKNYSALIPPITNTVTPITSYYYETPLVTSEPTYEFQTRLASFHDNTPAITITSTPLLSITKRTQNFKWSDITESNSLPLIICGILFFIAFALLIRR